MPHHGVSLLIFYDVNTNPGIFTFHKPCIAVRSENAVWERAEVWAEGGEEGCRGVQGSGMGTGPLLLTMAPGWLSVNSGTAHDVEIGWICTEQSRYQPGFGNA